METYELTTGVGAVAAGELPGEEYDRRVAERRAAAKRSIRRCVRWWLAGHACLVGAVVLFAVGLVAGFNGEDGLSGLALIGAGLAAIATPFLATVPAGWGVFVAVRHRAVLSWPWIVYGLVPWAGLSTEVSAWVGLQVLAGMV